MFYITNTLMDFFYIGLRCEFIMLFYFLYYINYKIILQKYFLVKQVYTFVITCIFLCLFEI